MTRYVALGSSSASGPGVDLVAVTAGGNDVEYLRTPWSGVGGPGRVSGAWAQLGSGVGA
ncbi:hypothetical protein ACI78V_21395 [Geodermatophilus sp. SYSU D00742]